MRIRARAAVGRALRRGPRTVLLTPAPVRVGNLLYFWLQAHRRRAAGQEVRAALTANSIEWLDEFALADHRLVVDRPRAWDRREEHPASFYQGFGTDFTAADLATFIDGVLLRGRFGDRVEALATTRDPGAGPVTVNLRRGDYYSVPAYRARYGFDQVGYVRAAVTELAERAPITGIEVVSDDPDWCLVALRPLAAIAPLRPVIGSPVEHLAALAGSRRLVVTNSTFSYWGGYLSAHRHRHDPAARVVAPRFHARDLADGHAWQLDPRWSIRAGFAGPDPTAEDTSNG